MFEDVPVSNPRVKLFLKYLINAAARVGEMQGRADHDESLDNPLIENEIAKRIESMNNGRREELETKIKVFYTKNKYLPLELRLRKIRRQFVTMKRQKRYNRKKLEMLKDKIGKCQVLLKRIEQLDLDS